MTVYVSWFYITWFYSSAAPLRKWWHYCGTWLSKQTLPGKDSVRSTLFIHTCLPPHSLDVLHVGMDHFWALRSLIRSFPSLKSVFPLLLLKLCHHLPSLLSDWWFLFFLKYVFTETPPTSAMHSAVFCRGSVLEPACVQLGAVPQATASVLPLPTNTLPPTPMQYYISVYFWKSVAIVMLMDEDTLRFWGSTQLYLW